MVVCQRFVFIDLFIFLIAFIMATNYSPIVTIYRPANLREEVGEKKMLPCIKTQSDNMACIPTPEYLLVLILMPLLRFL